jgi:hypothetical protein
MGALRACLRMSECVDARDNWVAKPGTAMVLLGDVVDRFRKGVSASDRDPDTGLTRSLGETRDEEGQVLRLLNKLAAQAEGAGCWLYRLVGNHEFMQTQWHGAHGAQQQYSSPFSVGGDDEDHYLERQRSFAHGEFHRLVGSCCPKVAVKIGSHVFCHGGFNLGSISAAGENNIIALANDAFARKWANPTKDDAVFDTIVNGCDASRNGTQPWSGLLWDDTLSHPETPEGACARRAATIVRELNRNLRSKVEVKHVVLSHCIQLYRDGEANGQVPARVVSRPDLDATDYTTRGDETHAGGYQPSDTYNRTINALCEGLVWRLDVGMSRGFAMSSQIVAEHGRWVKDSMRPAILVVDRDPKTRELHYTVRQSNSALY